MLTKIKQRNEGFTIVETLIVLAIAGLIILIVLLAVPALQRNSRNTNIKSDASALAGGITEYESNNNGASPAVADIPAPSASGEVVIGNASSVVKASAKVQASDSISVAASAATPAAVTSISPGTIKLLIGQTCGSGNVPVASPRAVAIYYPIEGSSTVGVGCIDS